MDKEKIECKQHREKPFEPRCQEMECRCQCHQKYQVTQKPQCAQYRGTVSYVPEHLQIVPCLKLGYWLQVSFAAIEQMPQSQYLLKHKRYEETDDAPYYVWHDKRLESLLPLVKIRVFLQEEKITTDEEEQGTALMTITRVNP